MCAGCHALCCILSHLSLPCAGSQERPIPSGFLFDYVSCPNYTFEILAWVGTQSKRLPAEIAAWTAWMELNAPGGAEGHEWFGEVIKGTAAERSDIRSFFDLLDLDDYVTFGGKG